MAFDIVELATLVLDGESGQPITHVLTPSEIDALLQRHGLSKAPTDGDAAAATSVSGQAGSTGMHA